MTYSTGSVSIHYRIQTMFLSKAVCMYAVCSEVMGGRGSTIPRGTLGQQPWELAACTYAVQIPCVPEHRSVNGLTNVQESC